MAKLAMSGAAVLAIASYVVFFRSAPVKNLESPAPAAPATATPSATEPESVQRRREAIQNSLPMDSYQQRQEALKNSPERLLRKSSTSQSPECAKARATMRATRSTSGMTPADAAAAGADAEAAERFYNEQCRPGGER